MRFKFFVQSLSLYAPAYDIRGLLLGLGEDGDDAFPLASLTTLEVSFDSDSGLDSDDDENRVEAERLQEALVSVLEPRLAWPHRNTTLTPLEHLSLSRNLVGEKEAWYRERAPHFTIIEEDDED